MSNPDGRPAANRRQARIFKYVNVVMRRLLALPFRTPLSGRLMLLHHIGRKTGTHYRQPISYVPDGDTLLTPGGGRWTRNLRDGAPVQLQLRGQHVTARPQLIADPDEIDQLLQVMASRNPALNRYVPIPRAADGHYDRTILTQAVTHGFRLVRWHLDPATT